MAHCVPGNLNTFTFLPSSTNRCSRSLTWVVFPLLSKPSSTTSAPLVTPEEAAASGVCSDMVVTVDGAAAVGEDVAAVARSSMVAGAIFAGLEPLPTGGVRGVLSQFRL